MDLTSTAFHKRVINLINLINMVPNHVGPTERTFQKDPNMNSEHVHHKYKSGNLKQLSIQTKT